MHVCVYACVLLELVMFELLKFSDFVWWNTFLCSEGEEKLTGCIILVVGPAVGRTLGGTVGLTLCPCTVGKRVAPGNCMRFDGDAVGIGEGLHVWPRTVG